jgi:esterase
MDLSFKLWGAPDDASSDEISPKKPVISLLHGMGGTSQLWRGIAATLEDRFQVLAFDQRGHGQSRPVPHSLGQLPTYSPKDYGQDVLSTLKKLGVTRTLLVGHSMGVRSAIACAQLESSVPLAQRIISGLVLVDLGLSGPAGGGLGQGLAQFIRQLPESFESRTTAGYWIESHAPDCAIGQYLLAVAVSDLKSGSVTFPFDQSALVQTIEAARDFSVRAWAKAVASQGVPILFLRGAESTVWSSEDYQEELKQFSEYQNVTFEEWPGCGHGLPFEKRIEFGKRLIQAFETQTP